MQEMQEMQVRFLGQEDPLKEVMATYWGKPHGQRSLMGCSPQAHKESDVTEHTGMFCPNFMISKLSYF